MPDISSILALIAKPILVQYSRSRLPRINGELKLLGLNESVEVFRDRWGIPHIHAQDLNDLFFVQGYVHAQDRLWQMEFNRRLVAGRLSEVFESSTIPVDRWMRTLTMRHVAEYEVNLLDGSARVNLQAYADGINARIALGRLPIEFSLLRYKPEPWIIADTLAWIKMMSWGLSVNWESELLRAKLIDRMGPELAAELEPPHLARWPYIVPPGADYSHIGESALERAYASRPFTGPSPYEGLGSNNWALSGTRTVSGKPIFANDMHLPINIPAIWYENHLAAGDLNVTGVSFPGIPGVISGHNGHVAWGFTNGFPDVQDIYMERLQRTGDGRVQAEYNGAWEDVNVLHERIDVKGSSTITEEVIITRHGPIINSLAPDLTGEQPLALRWTSLEPDTMVHGIFEMAHARNCQEFHQALRHWTSPVVNAVYADTSGNIAYTFPGKVPVRSKGSGRVPVPGWTDEYEWLGYLPYDALPHLFNPPQEYIATANNRTVSDDYPIRLDLEPISGDRAQRIAEMILNSDLRAGREQIDISFVQKMHFDQYSPSARVVARYLGALKLGQSSADQNLEPFVRLMKEWDGELSAESPAAALYQVFIRTLARLMLKRSVDTPLTQSLNQDDQPLSEAKPIDLATYMLGKGPIPMLLELSLFGEYWLPWLIHLLAEPDSPWFDLGNGETRDEAMRLALQTAVDQLKETLGPRVENWAWGKLHMLTYSHTCGSTKLLETFLNRGPYPMGGDHTTIWATGTNYHDLGAESAVGPPFRMIIDLGDLRNSLGLLTPGQSGNPASPHYDDQIEAWFTGEYHPMLFFREDVERESPNLLRLLPK